MGGCSAANCSNHSRNGFRMFRFPSNKERRQKWIINCRRMNWEPSSQAQICINHFEESQFESHIEGPKKLRRDAVPTIFDVPNPPPSLTEKRKKGIGCPKPKSILDKKRNEKENSDSNTDLAKKIEALEKENKMLKEQIKERDLNLSSFLSKEQIAALDVNRSSISNWSEEAIIKGLKIRFSVGKHGYNYLRSIGYPTPSYSTLNRRIKGIKIPFGVMDMLFYLLKAKIESLDIKDKNCCLLVDDMDIANHQDFDSSSKSFVGNVTLGKPGIAKHYTVVMLRGLCSPWKQVVAHQLTGPSTSGPDMKLLIFNTINAARSIGLKVRASTSDMGSNNKAFWNSVDIGVSRNERHTFYTAGNADKMHCIADVPHLLKNMRSAFLSRILILPEAICQAYDLPSTNVSSGFLKQLWISEINSVSALRSLHHLNKIHVFPTHFSKMNVATAVQLFSTKTAAALEKAVSLKQLQKGALTSAWWIRIMAEWFELMTARHPKCGITVKNKERKFQFLHSFIDVMQNIQLGKGWKPLQTGMIMSTLSVINLATELFCEGFTIFLPGRLTQDALENVFSQVRRKSATKPTALQAQRALKLICVSQFISDITNSNYSSESDYHLLRTISVEESLTVDALQSNGVQSIDEPSASHCPVNNPMKVAAEENDIYYIAGATLRAVLSQKRFCEACRESLKTSEDELEAEVPRYRTLLTEYCDMGELHKPNSGVYRVCREAERIFQKNKHQLLSLQLPITNELVETVKNNCTRVPLPTCCNIIEAVINHYLLVRCKGLKTYLFNKRAHDVSFGSASVNKKQKLM